jgi:hypothetical protein
MTKKEFEKWKRLCYEKSEVELRGYIYIHKDCPLLTEEEKNKKWKESFDFRTLGSDLIQGDYLVVGGKMTKNPDIRHIHRKWIESIHMFHIFGWEDKGGKRESKLNWVLKNLKNENLQS